MTRRTLAFVKPNAVEAGHIGDIIGRYEKEGFAIRGLKMLKLSPLQASAFYAEHEGKYFFPRLIEFITSGPICALVLEAPEAIERNREVMGATDPDKAEPGTLRAAYAESMTKNAVHGSDSEASAAREIAFFFSEKELWL